MASIRRGLVDTVKKAAAKVSKRGVQVAAKAGTRGARALVETTAVAVKTVDKIQEKIGRGPRKPSISKQTPVSRNAEATSAPPSTSREDSVSAKPRRTSAERVAETPAAKPRRTTPQRGAEATQPVPMRETGRKTMASEAPAPKRAKAPQPQQKQFKVKRGQKHLHSGR
ncbi:hypothetical protein [Hyalangium rubrum]|uniref:Uncharacterized protein n=1 Tax=Hyalangium rubrum TaxID=3103134 RepID=A0ABU5HCY9_9BACT|nr:hypothetical protein [Hyalangium sp. s54d21]MDY7231336.1 hypothetical protein [Hyalangium sp. s54d21]